MRLFMAAARWLTLFLVPLTVSALGLGDIAVNSSLNEPFSAEIPLESLETTELAELTVELASPETFRRYGLDRPAYLNNIRFAVEDRPGGKPVILLTSVQPVSEPFVTLLLDVRWPSGRLLREYTALLDPPLFEDTATTLAAPVTAAQTAPETQPSTATAGAVARPDLSAVAETNVVEPTGLFQEPRDEVAAPPPAPAEPAVREEPVVRDETAAIPAPVPSIAAADSYTAINGDTLWRIAQRVRGDTGLDTNQMMLALYRANPDAFMGNINALKAGAILRIPPGDAASTLSVAEAVAEVQQQNSAWGGGARPSGEAQARLQLVAPSDGDSAVQASAPASAGASGAEVPAADENAGQSQARIKVLEQQLDESKRLLAIRDSEMQSLQQRIAELEKSVDAAPAEAETGDLAADAPVTAAPLAEAPLVTEEPGAEETAAEEPADVQEPVAQVSATEKPSADVSSIEASTTADDDGVGESQGFLGNMWIWAAVAGALLLAFFVVRQRKTAAAGSTPDRWSAQREEVDHADTLKDFSDLPSNQDSIVVEESAFTATDVPVEDAGVDIFNAPVVDKSPRASGNAFATDKFSFGNVDALPADFVSQDAAGQDEVELPLEKTISTGAPLNLDQADPVAEAEFHMAYGLYDQAADLLTRALKDDPENRAYRLKLIEVFFVWENKDGFLQQARILQAGGVNRSDSDWNKVLILGKQLCPSDPLFSGVASSPAAGSIDLELSDAGETSIDFSVDAGDAGAVELGFDTTGGELDLDLTSGFGRSGSDDESAKNFGNKPTDSSGVATIALDSSALDFDMGESDDAATMESPTLDVMGAGSPTLAVDFDLDGGETMESPTLAGPANEPTLESPTLDALGAGAETSEMPSLGKSGSQGFDSEPPMDPTGLDIDLSGLADLPLDSDDFAAMDSGAADSSSPVFGDDKKRLAPETENIFVSSEDATIFASLEQLGKVAGDTHEPPANPKASDTLQQPQFDDEVNDTAEQPGISDSVDLDGEFDDFVVSDDPKFADDATMTEVGTKLDLARAYIDMGDPDGARSILEEVLDEGGEAQQQQARQLLNELND